MLEKYRNQYAEFNSTLMREYYLFLSGQKTDLRIAPIYDRYGDLFTRDSITSLKQSLDQTPEHYASERKATKRLLIFAVEQYLENSAKELTKAINEYESASTIEWAGRRITFQDSAVAIRTERDRATRRAIYAKRTEVIAASNDLRAERVTKLHETARSLGHANYTAMYEELRGLDYKALADQAESVLSRTEAVYTARLAEALGREAGLAIGEADRSDALYFLHLNSYDDHFPASDLMRIYRETMAGLGIDVEKQKNILVDSEPRPRKTPRAFCMPILVPEEVKLVIRPMGGQADYQAFFHESGHAQHYGGAAESLRPEFKYTGDYALSESYAFLFNHLISDGAWLAQMLKFHDSDSFIRAEMLARLSSIRRYVAKLKYEYHLHTDEDLARAADLYSEFQTGATRFRTGTTEFLFDLDDAFYSANYVRAWGFEVMLREYLKTRFGSAWWTSPRAGALLRELWETGDQYTADDIAELVGVGPISFDLLIDQFNQGLK
ncbi:MAG TPA: hypothetical protein VKA70_20775 [Blastocatellia bacterium]|nr:hypothetical protein [Blastocatellia bacterium]